MAGKTKDKTKEDTTSGKYGGGHTPLTYNSYLKVEELKKLQQCQSEPAHHDEPLFIVIHQSYELWFKLILHEMDEVVKLMQERNIRRSCFYLKRVVAILRQLVGQIHILETMAPKEFLEFRHHLNPASGFQSSQFREIEFMAGMKSKRMLDHFKEDSISFEKLTKRFEEDSLLDLFYKILEEHGFDLPFNDPDNAEDEQKRLNELRKLYDETDKYYDLHTMAELFMDIDEALASWRSNHVTVVERIIGFKQGTGGSDGVDYLRMTLSKRGFPDFWKLRTEF